MPGLRETSRTAGSLYGESLGSRPIITTNYLPDPSRPMADKRLAAFERREFVDPTYATPDQINDQFNAQFNAHTNDALTAFVVVAGTLASFSPKVEVEARR